jgi:hypothetical protein
MLVADGHPMPTTAQGYIDGLSASDFQADDERRAIAAETATSLWDDYQVSYGGHDDPEGVRRAVQAVVNELRERGVTDTDRYIARNRHQFLEAVNYWHQHHTYTNAYNIEDDGRTAGLSGGFGHSEDVESKQDYAAWDMDKSDVERGYSKPGSGGAGEPGTASFPQSLPTENPGNPPERYAREGHAETGAHTGRGNDKPSPGREAMGSSKLPS